ncbi:MAG: type II secretion system protein M [Syntrophobacterales bacterium]|nr:type II secretion system protein M [Syntrophobacterales bacterium]
MAMDYWTKFKFRLTKRERYYVSAGIVMVILIVILQFALFPFLAEKKKVRRSIQAKEQTLKKLISLSSEYMALKTNSVDIEKALAGRPGNFTLFSFLEKQAGRSGVKPNIKYMKPSTSTNRESYNESTVEMKLENVTLEQLVEYLYLVESPENLVMIKRISIKQSRGSPEYLTVLMQLVTYLRD